MKRRIPQILINTSLCLAIASFFGIPIYLVVLRPAIEWQLFRSEYEEMDELMQRWGEEPPEGMDKHVWQHAFKATHAGFANACYSPESITLKEMRRLNSDLRRKLQEPTSLKALEWIWNRLGETGPHGHEYTTRERPVFDEAIKYARQKSTRGP